MGSVTELKERQPMFGTQSCPQCVADSVCYIRCGRGDCAYQNQAFDEAFALIESLERDAARYRWLRNVFSEPQSLWPDLPDPESPEDCDRIIDRAISGEPK